MSAPDTDIKKEEKRHGPSLVGIAVSVIFALVLLAFLTIYVVNRGGEPEGAETQLDTTSGEVEQTGN